MGAGCHRGGDNCRNRGLVSAAQATRLIVVPTGNILVTTTIVASSASLVGNVTECVPGMYTVPALVIASLPENIGSPSVGDVGVASNAALPSAVPSTIANMAEIGCYGSVRGLPCVQLQLLKGYHEYRS
ncbi:hypothetical protein H6P81_002611 [Aristolochia fimbriata]|uniref:Uncharacterized protein n=1 Tax=Aristolochia fimbriata TaxID=158543 RepID=A0AAV7FET8_ARIFI|nr:hypothetical protein H6P81_002611 [Aristolochia fimbriata]